MVQNCFSPLSRVVADTNYNYVSDELVETVRAGVEKLSAHLAKTNQAFFSSKDGPGMTVSYPPSLVFCGAVNLTRIDLDDRNPSNDRISHSSETFN